jgi:tetratricopeptide (TPR) repeat protein
MLANLGFELEKYAESKHHAKMFLKKYPRNYDMLHLLAMSHMKLEEREEALDALRKIKTIDPYNGKIQDMIDKVNLEIEMEKNFKQEEN